MAPRPPPTKEDEGDRWGGGGGAGGGTPREGGALQKKGSGAILGGHAWGRPGSDMTVADCAGGSQRERPAFPCISFTLYRGGRGGGFQLGEPAPS